MLRVHHLSNSRSQRILWLMEELGLEYELVKHMRDPVTVRSPPSLFEVHPLGKGPTIEHDGKALTESGAIIDYVTRRIAGGRLAVPESSPDFADYCFWLHYAEGSAMQPVVFDLLDGMTGRGCGEALRGFFMAEIEHSFAYISDVLSKQDHFIRSGFTAADINMTWVLELAEPCGHLEKQPQLRAYLNRMHARPAYRRAMDKGGEQDLFMFRPAAALPLT
ncbi:MAG: glutathione S-transferase [Panacagrimonas sp.]|nr:glutathione S-transferase [Panacagrimonas sp.]MCC2656742.1 glutathione S-transferase [Panacagrimonas sp.]